MFVFSEEVSIDVLLRTVSTEKPSFVNSRSMGNLPWGCDFGGPTIEDGDMCGFKQDEHDSGAWVLWNGGTITEGTGPPAKSHEIQGSSCWQHTSWTREYSIMHCNTSCVFLFSANYIYMEASSFVPNDRARIISPTFPTQFLDRRKCLSFLLNMFGSHIGQFNVLDQYRETIFSAVGGKQWKRSTD